MVTSSVTSADTQALRLVSEGVLVKARLDLDPGFVAGYDTAVSDAQTLLAQLDRAGAVPRAATAATATSANSTRRHDPTSFGRREPAQVACTAGTKERS